MLLSILSSKHIVKVTPENRFRLLNYVKSIEWAASARLPAEEISGVVSCFPIQECVILKTANNTHQV